jgi:DNA-binding transcriptional regulator PaaX
MSFKVELLEIIEGLGELVPGFFESKGMYAYRLKRRMSRPYYHQTVNRLKKEGLIKPQSKRKKRYPSYAITRKGLELLRKKSNQKTSRSDGLLTFVIFDIPEEKANARRVFRRFLVKNGFTLIQKSTLVSRDRINQAFRDLVIELGIKDNIKVISGLIDHIY